MGQVKILTLCRQGSVLETLFVPRSGGRINPGHHTSGRRVARETVGISSSSELNTSVKFAGPRLYLCRVVRAEIKFGARNWQFIQPRPGSRDCHAAWPRGVATCEAQWSSTEADREGRRRRPANLVPASSPAIPGFE